MHLGEIAGPDGSREVDLQAAKEIIDLLIAIKEKTAGNTSAQENEVFESVLPGLQLKFAEKA